MTSTVMPDALPDMQLPSGRIIPRELKHGIYLHNVFQVYENETNKNDSPSGKKTGLKKKGLFP
jgi:hypothetical protein